MLLGSVEDRADTGLARPVLDPKPRQPREPSIDLALIVELITVLARKLCPVVRVRHGRVAFHEGVPARMAGFPAAMAFLEQFAGTCGKRLGWMIGEKDAERVIVVDRHPGVAAQIREFGLRRYQRIKRHHELVDAPIMLLLAELPLRRDAHAKVLANAFE